MDDAVHSERRRRRWPALVLFAVFVLFTWWLTAATWIDAPSARGQHPAAAIVQWLLSPLLAGMLAAWWYLGRRGFRRGLLTCAGAGLLVSLVNLAFIATWPVTIYPEGRGPDLTRIDLDLPIALGLVDAILGMLGGGVYLGLARLIRRRSKGRG